jgi:tetratricopeptide (TPR) repeat protein
MDLEATWAAGRPQEGLAWCMERLGQSSDGLYVRYALEFALELGENAVISRLSELENHNPDFLALKSYLLWQRGRLPEALETAQQAYSKQPSFLTAFALGAAVALRSAREAEGWLMEALRLAETAGQSPRAAQAAAHLASLQVALGSYGRAETWAGWGLRLFEQIGMKHPGVWNSLVLALGHAQMLGGRLEALPALDPTQPEAALAQGDFLLAQGQAQEALATYAALDQTLYPIRELRLPVLARRVRALLELGHLDQAQSLGREALALSEGVLEVFRGWGELAYCLPAALVRPSEAVERLPGLFRRLLRRPTAPRAAMAAFYLARAYLALGMEGKARATIAEAAPVLEGLSPGGRAFLAGPPEMFEGVWALMQPTPPLRLHLLGRPSIWLGSRRLQLGPRQQEILAALALHPEGLSAEQLALLVWGEAGRPQVARAEVRRLRQKLPVQGNPYRLPPGAWADFLEVRRRLLQPDLEGALALYAGPLLPGSEAPGVVELRQDLWDLLKAALHHQGSPEQIFETALQEDDPELWQAALDRLSKGDTRRALLEARLRRFLAG